MRRLAVPVTKNNLLRLRGDLVFLRAGRELLDQKREFLSDALLTFDDGGASGKRAGLSFRRSVQ